MKLLPFVLIGLFTVTVVSKIEFSIPKKGIEKILAKIHHITQVAKKSDKNNDSHSLLILRDFSLKHDHLITYKITTNSQNDRFEEPAMFSKQRSRAPPIELAYLSQ